MTPQRAASLFGHLPGIWEPEARVAILRAIVTDVPWWLSAIASPGFRASMLFDCRRQLYGFGDWGEGASDGVLH